jgi:hypothetical protein
MTGWPLARACFVLWPRCGSQQPTWPHSMHMHRLKVLPRVYGLGQLPHFSQTCRRRVLADGGEDAFTSRFEGDLKAKPTGLEIELTRYWIREVPVRQCAVICEPGYPGERRDT